MIYGQLCEGDRLLSLKTGKWYDVTSVSTTDMHARIRMAGVAKLLIKPIGETIPDSQVQRGATGDAMDLFITIFSGEKRV